MENECVFMNSIGLMKSCDFFSTELSVHYLQKMINIQFDHMTIYVRGEMLSYFVYDILPKINKLFIIVSGDSDLTFPYEVLSKEQMDLLYNCHYLVKIFSQNTTVQNDVKIIQIPIGLDYHTISNNPNHIWKLCDEPHIPCLQEKLLMTIKNKTKPFYEREIKIYCNFTLSDFQDRWNHRKDSLKIIPKELLKINNHFTPRSINWNMTTTYAFVLSPFGRGMDCHRTWEILCLGSIPIVKAPEFKQLFNDLPVLIINEWNEINKELLENTILSFKNKKFDYKKLELKYWLNLIQHS